MKNFLIRIKHNLWMWMGRYIFFLPFFRLYCKLFNKGYSIQVTNKRTDLVIEGYPRSGNTFAYVAFVLSQKYKVNIAHHLHGSSQVKFAVKNNIPVLLLIREPEEAVISLIIRNSSIDMKQAFINYINFYSDLLDIKDKIVIADFIEITQDISKSISRLNDFYKTRYSNVNNSEVFIYECFTKVEEMDKKDGKRDHISVKSVAIPNKYRNWKKLIYKNIIMDDYEIYYLSQRAYAIYREVLNYE